MLLLDYSDILTRSSVVSSSVVLTEQQAFLILVMLSGFAEGRENWTPVNNATWDDIEEFLSELVEEISF
jgi:hypothetical protein